MKLKNMTVRGFESAADEVKIDFSSKPMIGFVGENGTGKSMLSIWAPMFALYGKTRAPSLKEAISSTSAQAYLELDFEVGGTDYRVVRHLPRQGRQKATLYAWDEDTEAWKPETEENVIATNKRIADIIGMDYDGATKTFVALQGQYGLFAESLPMERRRILMDLLSLDQYEDFHNDAKLRLNETQTKVSTLETQQDEIANMFDLIKPEQTKYSEHDEDELVDLMGDFEEQDREVQKVEAQRLAAQDNKEQELASAQKAINDFEASKRQDIQRLQTALNQYDPERLNKQKNRLNGELRGIEDAKMVLSQSESELSKTQEALGEAEFDHEDATERLDQIKSDGIEAGAVKNNLETRFEEVKAERAAFSDEWHEDTRCTTCHQHISPQIMERVRKEMDEDVASTEKQLEDAVKRYQGLRKDYAKASSEEKDAKARVLKLKSDLDQIKTDKTRAETQVSNESHVRESLAAVEDEIDNAAQERSRLNSELQDTENKTVPDDMTERLKRAEAVMNDEPDAEPLDYSARREVEAIQAELANREQARKKEAELDTRLHDVKTKLVTTKADEENYRILAKAFSPVGIPAMILAGAVTEIEDTANEYLEKFSKGALSLNIETQKENKDGNIQEKLHISVNSTDGTRAYNTYSGGQKFRIDLSLRIAMSKVAARRAGATAVDTFFIDEGFGALDEEGRLSTVEALVELSEEMTVIAVSHIESIKDMFPNLIETSMDTGTTTVNIVREDG